MIRIRLVISDFDRTFTDASLRVDPSLVDAINKLKKKGITFSIVSGRKYSFMYDTYATLHGLIDSFVAENGCVGYFEGRKFIIGDHVDREMLFKRLEAGSIPYDYGDVVVSVDHAYEPQLMDILRQIGDTFDVIKNIDSLMILPHDVSKMSGAAWLAGKYHVGSGDTACIGDAENDLGLRHVCGLLGAVSNAIPEMKLEADYVCQRGFGEGLCEFLEYIDARTGA